VKDEILRRPAVLARTKMSRATLYRRMAEGSFPKPIELGSKYMVGWLASEVEAWVTKQPRAGEREEVRASA
jgi:prophage regulatory protein